MPEYPHAHRQRTTWTQAGHTVSDPYRWLEEADTDDTVSWSAAQDALFADRMNTLPGRDAFADRIRDLLDCGVEGTPRWRGRRRFFMRRGPGQEHAALFTVDGDGPEHVLVDPMVLDPTGTTTLDSWTPDPAGRLLAYQLSHGGDEESLLYVMDVATGESVDGPVDRCRSTPIAWLADGSAFYYVRRLPPSRVPADETQYHRRVYLHVVGSDPDEDAEIFGFGRDMTEFYGLHVSHDGRWLTLTAAPGTAAHNDAWIADLDATGPRTPKLVPIQEGVDAEVYPHVGRDGRLYLFTDRDAPRARLCVADPAQPEYEHWTTLLAEDTSAVLTGFTVLDGAALGDAPLLLGLRQRHAISEVTVHDLADGRYRDTLTLPGPGSVGGLRSPHDGGHEAWLSYTDHATPTTVYRFDGRDGSLEVWAAPPKPPRVPEVRADQVNYTASDGATVHMIVLSPADATGPRPTILYGYGGFQISLTPSFSATALAWVEAGGTYVVANLRGGGEEGEEWHRAGMLANKQRVFDDYLEAANYLVATGVAAPDGLAAMGGSNGGLLVGAAVTQAPDRFAAAVCSAPLLDMLRYERFGLGRLWTGEFGSASDPEQFEWLHAYSPYHRVTEGVRYPATLFTVFDNDSRVDPLHARKMCAAMQHATSAPVSQRPVLLRREAEVGHSVRSVGRTAALQADSLAFLAHHTGLDVSAEEDTAESTASAPRTAVHTRVSSSPEAPSDRRHVHGCQVRYADLDPQNHVNNVRMLTYLEEARLSLLRWSSPQGSPAAGPMVISYQEAEYVRPLQLRPEPVRVEVWATRLRRASVDLNYEVRDDDHVYLRARTVLVGFDPDTQRIRRLTDAEHELLGRHTVD
nr:prolyl oligopeptidase family serine peptidase [Spiractinospora alimapuensis]